MPFSRIRAVALLGCCLQLLVTVGVPIFQFFLVFEANQAYMYIVIVTGASGLVAGLLGISSALLSGPVLPALHVVVSITLAALMGGFNTQTYLDLTVKCNTAQSAAAGCSSCLCAASSTCTTDQLYHMPGCSSCHAIGTDLCARSSRPVLLLPYTGLVQAVLLALPAVLSLLRLVRPAWPQLPLDIEGGRIGAYKDGRFAVTAWAQDERLLVQEDWPMTTATPVISGETGCKPRA